MNKALLTVVDGSRHEEFAEITLPTFQAYADTHGYDLVVEKLVSGAPSPTWSKTALLRRAIETYDFAFWVDCDAAISPDAPDVTSHLVDSHAFQALTFLNYWPNGLEDDPWTGTQFAPTLIATGTWLVQQHPFAVRFFDDLFAQTDLFTDPAAEAAAVWRLLGAGDDVHLIAENGWLCYPTGTVLLNDRWNSRTVDNNPHIFHATWLGATEQHELRLEMLREFVNHGTISPDLLDARHGPSLVGS